MSEKRRTGRILRPIKEIEEEIREQKQHRKEWIQDLMDRGCKNPDDPDELAKWEAEEAERNSQYAVSEDEYRYFMYGEEEKLQRIRDSRPLGVPPPIEPRSIHSSVPQPPWKRKLRP